MLEQTLGSARLAVSLYSALIQQLWSCDPSLLVHVLVLLQSLSSVECLWLVQCINSEVVEL